MKASHVMTTAVITARPETSIRDVAILMADRRISGLPVLNDGGKLVGIVSESDLLHRTEIGTERKRKWWLSLFEDSDHAAREYVKAHGMKVSDIMTRSVITVPEDADLSDVADLLERAHLKRVPVMRGEQLVGIIARGDLVRALARAPLARRIEIADDTALREAVLARMRTLSWLNSALVNLSVSENVVRVWGFVSSPAQRDALRVLIEQTEGVARVEDHTQINTARVTAT